MKIYNRKKKEVKKGDFHKKRSFLGCVRVILTVLALISAPRFEVFAEKNATIPPEQAECYIQVIEGVIQQYGDHPSMDVRDGETGLIQARLLDFNGDGQEELYVLFCNYNDGHEFMTEFTVEEQVWDFQNGTTNLIHKGEHTIITGGNMGWSVVSYLIRENNAWLLAEQNMFFHNMNSSTHIIIRSYENGEMWVEEDLLVEYRMDDQFENWICDWTINGVQNQTIQSDIDAENDLWAKANKRYETAGQEELVQFFNGGNGYQWVYQSCFEELVASLEEIPLDEGESEEDFAEIRPNHDESTEEVAAEDEDSSLPLFPIGALGLGGVFLVIGISLLTKKK